MSIYSDTHRMLFAKAHANRNKGLQQPPGVTVYSDIPYGECEDHPHWQLLDVYLPSSKKEAQYPVIISVHGGGWVEGDKDEYRFYCMNLVRDRYAVINFSYRLAPEYPFPAQLLDLQHIMQWIVAHHEEYHLDVSRVFALGDSAGGHILALYTALITGVAGDAIPIHHPKEITLRAIGLNCANLFFPLATELNTTQRHTFFDFLGKEPKEEDLQLIRLEHRITENYPPVFLISANKDPLQEQVSPFGDVLTKKGIDYQYQVYGSPEHPLGHVFFLDIRTPESEQATRDELSFFEDYDHE